MSSKHIRIGVGHNNYNAARCFRGANIPNVSFIRQPTLLPRQLLSRLPRMNKLSGSATCFIPWHKVDAYHTFNEVLFNEKPWFISFESVLPRVWDATSTQRRLLSCLAQDECRALLALSENAVLHLESRNQAFQNLDSILKKTQVVYPAIDDMKECFIRHLNRPKDRELFKMLFVGNEFFRKGGQLAVAAYERLVKNYPVQLTVVSNMQETNYVVPTQPGESVKWKARMEKANVTHLENISFEEVRSILSDSDLLLLPTMDDSFGYSVIEAMATGVVPVVTGIRALPEIVTDGKDGIIVDVPTTEEGRLNLKNTSIREIEDKLTSKLEQFFETKAKHSTYFNNARRTFEERFSLDRLARDLGVLYTEKLA